jgi:hypothetical protein
VDDNRREEIRRILKAELDEARDRHSCSAAFFDCLVPDIPSGLPAPDGSLLLHQAGAEAKDSVDQYARALKRFTDFVIYGTVPENFLS